MKSLLMFLTPKSEVAYLEADYTLRMAIEKMTFHHFSEIPVLDEEGKYVRSLSQADILLYLSANKDLCVEECSKIPLAAVSSYHPLRTLRGDSTVLDALDILAQQNFIPLVDDKNVFIGLVRRSKVLADLKSALLPDKSREKPSKRKP